MYFFLKKNDLVDNNLNNAEKTKCTCMSRDSQGTTLHIISSFRKYFFFTILSMEKTVHPFAQYTFIESLLWAGMLSKPKTVSHRLEGVHFCF